VHRIPFLARRSRATGAALLAAMTLGALTGPTFESSSAPAVAGRTVPYTPPPAPTPPTTDATGARSRQRRPDMVSAGRDVLATRRPHRQGRRGGQRLRRHVGARWPPPGDPPLVLPGVQPVERSRCVEPRSRAPDRPRHQLPHVPGQRLRHR